MYLGMQWWLTTHGYLSTRTAVLIGVFLTTAKFQSYSTECFWSIQPRGSGWNFKPHLPR